MRRAPEPHRPRAPAAARRTTANRALVVALAVAVAVARSAGPALAAADEAGAPWPPTLGADVELELDLRGGVDDQSDGFVDGGLTGDLDDGWDRKLVANGLAIGGGALFLAWAIGAWWSDGSDPFGIQSESFFGQDTYAGGADKLAHMWGGYTTARAVTSLYEWAGYPEGTSVWIGSGYSFGILLVAELGDGFTGFRFSFEDLLFNGAGAALGALLELDEDLDELIDFRVQYVPSQAFKDEGGGLNFAEDYSGMTFLLDLRLAGIPYVGETPLRFLDLDVGYETRGYRPREEDRVAPEERRFVAGVSIDLAEVLEVLLDPIVDGWDTPKSVVATIPRYYQVPYLRLEPVEHTFDP